MKRAMKLSAVSVIAILAAMALPAGAIAQGVTPSSPSNVDGVELVIVTAQKRVERSIDVPVAITAVSGATLSNRQIDGVAGLQALVPSLTFTQSTNDLNNNVRIRGVGTSLFNVGLESSVSFVLDGVVLSRQGQGFQDLIDIERIEVLRGPQGTLFGKNASAGVINVVTKRASREIDGTGEVTVSEGRQTRMRGTISGPLGEKTAGRLTGFFNDDPGFVNNAFDGRTLNGGQSFGFRGRLDYDQNADLSISILSDYRKSEADCCQFQTRTATNTTLASQLNPVVPGPENRATNINGDTFNNTEQWGLSVQADLSLANGHTLTSITAYRTWDFINNIDVDALPTDTPLQLPQAGFFAQFDVNGGPTNIVQTSQELRLTSPDDQRLKYVLGLFYFNLDLDRAFTRRFALCLPGGANSTAPAGSACPAPQFRSSFHSSNTTNDNYALFGQADFKLTDRLTLLGGLRYQYEKVTYEGSQTGIAPIAGDVAAVPTRSIGSGETDDTDLSGRVGLQFRINDRQQAYFTATRGYKGQGYNLEIGANFVNQEPVRPETVVAFELGYKASLFNRKLILTMAAFQSTYEDLQVQAAAVVNGINVFIPTNAGESTSEGFEIEFEAQPMRGLSLTGGLTVLDAKVSVDGLGCNLAQPVPAASTRLAIGQAEPDNVCFLPATVGTSVPAQRQNVADGWLPNAPDLRASFSARYQRPLWVDGFQGFVQVSALHQGETRFSLEQDPLAVQEAYTTVDLAFGVLRTDQRWGFTVFVRNLTDQSYATSIFRSSVFGQAANPNNLDHYLPKEARRTLGASFRVGF
jgi:iron complex outermembrane recepter protein